PRSPRAPDPPRLRRQEPADARRRGRARATERGRPRHRLRRALGPGAERPRGEQRMKHLLSIADFDRARIDEMLDLSEHFLEVTQRDIPKVPALRGKVVVSLFYEDSTRTRISFETAAKRLSCDVMSFSVGSSSVQKGESLRDTVQTIEAMGIDALVVRHM